MSFLKIVQGDHGIKLPFTVKKPNPIDLTGAIVKVSIRRNNETYWKQANIIDATKGKCELILTARDLLVSGVYQYQWTAYLPEGTIFSGIKMDIFVNERLLAVIGGGDNGETVIIPFATRTEFKELKRYVEDLVITGEGSVVVDSDINGNILVNGQEVIVYDDGTIKQRLKDIEERSIVTSVNGQTGDVLIEASGGGILSFNTVSELQSAHPEGLEIPVWIVSEKSWFYWNENIDRSLIVFDNFNRPDNVESLGSSQIGQVWTPIRGVWGIEENQAYVPNGTSDAIAYVETSKTDVSISVDIFGSGTAEAGIYFRVVDANNWFRFITPKSGTSYLQKRVSGITTTIAQGTFGISIPCNLKVTTKSDGAIEVFANDVSKLTRTDTALTTATKHGIGFGAGNAGYKFDNFTIRKT